WVDFYGSVFARHMHPALTSVRQPIEEMGRRMAQLLLEEIAGRTGERPTVVLPTELVVRDSS
ncbi:substrate-binding domain-containing protein, partial [Streptomyces sp. NPDC059607]|uniref:substrate-binding domain-containing protein n=1 Tax=Streptomyces sp. NPDC059607 TaxID=3346883 RepID=UPI0036B9859D